MLINNALRDSMEFEQKKQKTSKAHYLGFFISATIFAIILIFLLQGVLLENFQIVFALVLVNLVITVVLPKILKTKHTNHYKSGVEKFFETVTKAIVTVAVTVVYIFGVGFVAVVSKITGKKFLQLKKVQASTLWIKRTDQKIDFKEMF